MTAVPDKTNDASSTQWTVRRVLEWTAEHLGKHGSDTPRLDAEILLAHSRGCHRIELYTRFDEPLSEPQRATMRELVRRRAQAEPVAYLVGHREFYGLDFRVNQDVLIPRPDTETLVLELLDRIEPGETCRVLDIGTGSGCIAVAATVNRPLARVVAGDISEAALALARQNAATHGVADRIEFVCGNLFGPLTQGDRFDVIVSNPPYIADIEMDSLQADVRLHEPHLALTAGQDGLDILKLLIQQAPDWLLPGGWLFVEISPEQVAAVRGLFEARAAYRDVSVANDLANRARVVCAKV